jgi:hypothetical protein
LDPTGKSTTDVLELTRRYFIFAVYLVQGLLMDLLIDPKM